jgi:hypothetical protein
MTPSYNQLQQQQHASSNPWNITSSMSPSNTMGNNGGNLLYPTIGSEMNANPSNSSPLSSSSLSASRKTPESFLGDKFSTLVNLDKLVPDPKSKTKFFPFNTYYSFFRYKSIWFNWITYSKSIYKYSKTTNP